MKKGINEMFDILEHIIFVHIISIVIDLIIIGLISYLLIKNIGISILVSVLSNILMYVKGTLINKFLLS